MSILSSVVNNLTSNATNIASKAKKQLGSAFDILDPSIARRMISGLSIGGLAGIGQKIPQIGFTGASDAPGASTSTEDDWRVRISLGESSNIFYKEIGGNPLLNPLLETSGVIFPYIPSISVTHSANYGTQSLTHSNYGQHFYNNSDVQDITISGDFTVQTIDEGQYLMAAIYFFRSCTKMFFGQGSDVGNPPPIVFLDGFGSHYFPHVPCVITGFTHTLSPEVDYIPIPVTSVTLQEVEFPQKNADPNSRLSLDQTNANYSGPVAPNFGGGSPMATPSRAPDFNTGSTGQSRKTQQFSSITSTTRVPTSSNISITLKPMYSRKNLHDNFNLTDFAQGKLLGNKTTGTGGFL